MSKPRYFTIFLLGTVFIGGVYYYLTRTSAQVSTTYQTAIVEKGTILSTVNTSGAISVQMASISSSTTGVISKLYVKNGDVVSVGAPLFEVVSTASEDEKAKAYANYLAAKSSLINVKSNKLTLDTAMWTAQKGVLDAENTKNYKDANTINPSTKASYTELEKLGVDSTLTNARKSFATAEQKYKDADVAISAAQASLQSAWLSYQATQNATITTSVAGTVANLTFGVGALVTASGTAATTSGASVLTIMNPDSLEVKVQLSEVDAPKVRVGQKATIKVNAFNTKSYVAQVDRIDTIGTVSSGVVVYNAYLRFVSTPPEIYPSMNINAVIQIDRKDDVVKVPTSAIKIANDARTIQIMRTDKNLPETAEIHTGMVGDIDTEIMSGVQVGDMIVTRTITPKATSTTSPFSSIGGTRGLGGGGR